MRVGYNKPLYILPFDHRGSFQKKMFGWEGTLSAAQTAEIAAAKKVIYDGFKQALENGVPKDRAGILLDEEFGLECLKDAKQAGITIACPAEKSGQSEFDFEYGEDFGKHIEKVDPHFCKVLVRYNVEDEAVLNDRQAKRLARLSDYLHQNNRKFMFELLVPATDAQLKALGGDKKKYDRDVRPDLMIAAIHALQERGVEPDVWKIEGLDKREDCVRVAQATRRDGRSEVGNIVLGRGEDDKKVVEWLKTAAGVPGFIGFAVGRTTFWDPLKGFLDKKIVRDEAVSQIAKQYKTWVDIFENAR